MTFDAAALNVLSLIAHQIPHRNKNEPLVEIPLSEVVPEVPPETLGFFNRRLLRTLQSRGQDVEVDDQRTDNVLPAHLIAKLSGETDLVEFSQAAARHLYTVQGGTSSEGLLVVCELSLNGEAAVALMKLEEEEGVLVEDTEVGGLHTLSVVVLDSLLLD